MVEQFGSSFDQDDIINFIILWMHNSINFTSDALGTCIERVPLQGNKIPRGAEPLGAEIAFDLLQGRQVNSIHFVNGNLL